MAYELVDDFQYLNDQKQILKITKGTKIDNEVDGFFMVKIKGKIFKLEKEIVIKNPDFFKKIDWVSEVAEIIKKNKKATSPRLAKMISDYVDDNLLKGHTLVDDGTIQIMLSACANEYERTKDDKYLSIIKRMTK